MAADADLRARVEQLERSLAEARVALSDERAVHEKERIEWNQDRQKLRTLEQQFLLDRAHNAAKSRQWRVSGGLAGLGAVILITATPFVIVQPFGLLGGGLGYGPAACCTGIALFFLAALPVYARLVRLLSGFIVWVATLNCCIWILVPLLSVSGAFCGFPSPEMCNVVVAGMSGSSLTLGSWIIAMAVRTLRLVPAAEDEGERVPLSKVWPWAVARVGPWAAAFGMVMAFPGVWAAAQPDSSFVMSPRAALIFHWQILRLSFLGYALTWIPTVAVGYAVGADHAGPEQALPSGIFFAATCLVLAAISTSANRGKVHQWLGRLAAKEETSAASVVAAVVGGIPAHQAVDQAQRCFRGVLFSSLTVQDFRDFSSLATEAPEVSSPKRLSSAKDRTKGLRDRTVEMRLGQVDIFLSHSWHGERDWDRTHVRRTRHCVTRSRASGLGLHASLLHAALHGSLRPLTRNWP